MRILLVRPPRIKQAISLSEFMFSEPIGLECVLSVLKDEHQVKILDLMIEGEELNKELENFKPEAVGITSLCIDVNAVKKLALEVKQFNRNIVVVVGGTQAFLNPAAFYNEAIDHVMRFTTVKNLKELFSALNNGIHISLIDGIHSRQNNYESTDVQGINEYIAPDRSSTEKYRQHYSYFGYKPCAIMQTSQGCSKTCSFCLRWRIEGHYEKDIPIECIIDQIKEIDEPSIMIFDNDFLYNGKRLEEFCNELETNNLKKNFICYASVKSILENTKEIKRFRNNGLSAVLVGYESFSEEELKKYHKKSSVEDNIKASKILKQLKIDCWASFMMHPDWDKKDFKSFRRFVKTLKPEISSLSPLTPFPNLPMYETYKGRLLFAIEDYEQWSFGKVSIMPSKVSLRTYYYELLKTNLYINLILNSISYMVRKFGIGTILRMTKGSMRLMNMYVKLMINAK